MGSSPAPVAMPGKSWVVRDRGADTERCGQLRGSMPGPGLPQQPRQVPGAETSFVPLQTGPPPGTPRPSAAVARVSTSCSARGPSGPQAGRTGLALRCPRRHWGGGLPGGAQRTWAPLLVPSEEPTRTVRQDKHPTKYRSRVGCNRSSQHPPATQPLPPRHRGDRAGPTRHRCRGGEWQEETRGPSRHCSSCLFATTATRPLPPGSSPAQQAAKVSAPPGSGDGHAGPARPPTSRRRPSCGLWALLAPPLRASPGGGASSGPGRGENRLVEGAGREEGGRSPRGRRRGTGGPGGGRLCPAP